MSLTNSKKQALIRETDCEIRCDDLTRNLYATDASIYQIVPDGVAFPRMAEQASGLIRVAADAGIPIVPRGAGTGLVGGCVGSGIVVDFARYNRQITEFDRQKRTVRVGPGVVLDQLNEFLRPHGLWFGPDVATSSRATLGGMIANNSSGAHVPVYGTTVDHVVSLDVVLADGKTATLGRDHDSLTNHRASADRIVDRCADQIAERMPANYINKRWPGYGFDYYQRSKGDLTRLIAGSEGTLAAITSAVVNVVPLPPEKVICVIFFASVPEAMQATVELLDLEPAAIEHIDRLLFDQTKGKRAFKTARAFLELDAKPCESILIVEFFEHSRDKLDALAKRDIGLRKIIPANAAEQELVWMVRRDGLSLLTACKGSAKPTPGLEDVAVPATRLPEYVAGLRSIYEPLGLQTSFYGHACSGLLHVRPKVDLHTAGDIAKYRKCAESVSALCKQFKGSLAGEHGVGIARTDFLPEHLGPELMAACKELKQVFDPKNVFNPGKIVSDGRYRFETNLRQGAGHEINLPFEPVFGFIERDDSYVGNLEQCNGCAGCRKDPPTMCPTYQATGEEIMVTRGRSNTIRAALEGRFEGDIVNSPELDEALSNCLSCKACKTECPSNVDLALLKAELIHARQEKSGVPLVDRMIANADLLGRLNAGLLAPITNAILKMKLTRWLMEKTLGFTSARTMPPYTSQRFDRWFAKRENTRKAPTRGKVILWDDCWVRYNEPNIGQAAVKVLEAAGFEIVLPEDRKCCGRPACSRGVLNMVKRLGQHNVDMFNSLGGDEPIIFLEASCYTMFIDEYRQLKIPGADSVASRCVLFEQFVYDLLRQEPKAIAFKNGSMKAAIHGHCHAKALTDASIMPKLIEFIPNASAELMATGCCGMAGAFGMLKKKYELSKQVAQPLVDKINALPPGTFMVASGTSCRHQITHLTDVEPLHMAELLARAVTDGGQ